MSGYPKIPPVTPALAIAILAANRNTKSAMTEQGQVLDMISGRDEALAATSTERVSRSSSILKRRKK